MGRWNVQTVMKGSVVDWFNMAGSRIEHHFWELWADS